MGMPATAIDVVMCAKPGASFRNVGLTGLKLSERATSQRDKGSLRGWVVKQGDRGFSMGYFQSCEPGMCGLPPEIPDLTSETAQNLVRLVENDCKSSSRPVYS